MRRAVQFLTAAAAVVVVTGCSGSSSQSDSSTPATPRSTAPAPDLTTTPATYPVGLADVAGKPWVVETGSGKVGPLDDLKHAVSVGATPLRATYDRHLLWVSVFGAGQVVAVDPTTGKVVVRSKIGGEPEGIVSAFGHVWVVQQKARRLAELDNKGKIIRVVATGEEPRQVAASRTALYVSDFGAGDIYRVDPKTAKVTSHRHVCDGAQGMAATKYSLWATCTSSDRVVAVNPTTLHRQTSFHVAGEPDAIHTAGGTVYVALTNGPALVQLPASGDPVPTLVALQLGDDLPLGDRANVDLLLIGKRFWVSSPNGGDVIAGSLG
ncbi:MAG: hypothetical protein JO246_12595 [Frankiaceae bacterium]|nr:hypothetical protein [Frankiaceae bacterium]MBV9870173.1 hypothetical protein [Frankiaceae bacterium]